MTMPMDADEWQELMGTDLCMKVLPRYGDVDGDDYVVDVVVADVDGEEDAHEHEEEEEEQSVQLHDIVEIDWIGYYCDEATKRQLGIPPGASSSSSLVVNESPLLPVGGSCSTGTSSPTPSPHVNHNPLETDTTAASSSSSSSSSISSVRSILKECPIFHAVQNFYCDVGDQDVIPAVEMGLRFLHIVRKRRRRRRLLAQMVDETEEEEEDPIRPRIQPTVALIYSHSKYAYGISSRTSSTMIVSDDTTTTTGTTTTGTLRNRNDYTLPSLSNVIYQVTLKRIVSSSTTLSWSPKILLQLFNCKKHLANDIYQNDILVVTQKTRDGTTTTTTLTDASHNQNSYHCQRAVRIYQRTVEKLEHLILDLQNATNGNKNHDGKESDNIVITESTCYIQEAQQLQIDCLNNISAVYLKCRLYHKAKEACIETLLKDPNNAKALIRAAKAALYDPSSSYEEVEAAFQAVQDIVATADATRCEDATSLQKDVTILQKDYVQHQAKYKREQKQMAVRIQEKLFKNRRRPQQPPPPQESPTDVTTKHASRPGSTTTTEQNDTRDKKPPTLHDTEPAATWFGNNRIPTSFTNVSTTTKLFCSTMVRILFLWILCLYGFMGYLLLVHTHMTNHQKLMTTDSVTHRAEMSLDE